MTLQEILDNAQKLNHDEKMQLLQMLMDELNMNELFNAAQQPIWTPYDAFEAAQIMQQMLEKDAKRGGIA